MTKKKQSSTPISPAVKRTLGKFGLSDKEITVYTHTLKHDETSPYALARETGIPRTTIYDILMTLSLKGLVTLQQSDGISKQQTKIRAKNPSVMRQIIKHRRDSLTSLEVDILDILPELKEDYHQNEANANFRFYPGVKGVREVYLAEETNVETPSYAFENLMPMDVFGRKETNQVIFDSTKRRIEAGNTTHELVTLNDWTKHVLSYQAGHDPNYLIGRTIRYVENSLFDPQTRVAIQANRIMIMCAKDEEIWGLTINSPALSTTLKGIFQTLWQTAKPVDLKLVKSWGENEFLKQEKNRKQ